MVLHAAAVVGRRGAVLIGGASGAGKSTLLAALHRRGYRLLAADQSAITRDGNSDFVVHPGACHMKLWADAAARFSLPISDSHRVRPNVDKYRIPMPAAFSAEAAPLASIFVLERAEARTMEITRLENSSRFHAIRGLMRNLDSMAAMRVLADQFAASGRLASTVPIFRVQRPLRDDTVTEIANVVVEELL